MCEISSCSATEAPFTRIRIRLQKFPPWRPFSKVYGERMRVDGQTNPDRCGQGLIMLEEYIWTEQNQNRSCLQVTLLRLLLISCQCCEELFKNTKDGNSTAIYSGWNRIVWKVWLRISPSKNHNILKSEQSVVWKTASQNNGRTLSYRICLLLDVRRLKQELIKECKMETQRDTQILKYECVEKFALY